MRTMVVALMVGSGILVPFERTTDGLDKNEGFVSRNFIVALSKICRDVEFGSVCVVYARESG